MKKINRSLTLSLAFVLSATSLVNLNGTHPINSLSNSVRGRLETKLSEKCINFNIELSDAEVTTLDKNFYKTGNILTAEANNVITRLTKEVDDAEALAIIVESNKKFAKSSWFNSLRGLCAKIRKPFSCKRATPILEEENNTTPANGALTQDPVQTNTPLVDTKNPENNMIQTNNGETKNEANSSSSVSRSRKLAALCAFAALNAPLFNAGNLTITAGEYIASAGILEYIALAGINASVVSTLLYAPAGILALLSVDALIVLSHYINEDIKPLESHEQMQLLVANGLALTPAIIKKLYNYTVECCTKNVESVLTFG